MASTMKKLLTREECENLINEKLHEIVEIYHQYNPEGQYITLYYSDQAEGVFYGFNNRYWDKTVNDEGEIEQPAGEDYNCPINFWKKEEGAEE